MHLSILDSHRDVDWGPVPQLSPSPPPFLSSQRSTGSPSIEGNCNLIFFLNENTGKKKNKNSPQEWNLGVFCDFAPSRRRARGSKASPVSGFDVSSQTLATARTLHCCTTGGFHLLPRAACFYSFFPFPSFSFLSFPLFSYLIFNFIFLPNI